MKCSPRWNDGNLAMRALHNAAIDGDLRLSAVPSVFGRETRIPRPVTRQKDSSAFVGALTARGLILVPEFLAQY
jgi:hypothetical protein